MGDESRRHPPVCALDPPLVPFEPHIEGAMDSAVLCDCHCGPMYYFPVSLNSTSDFMMCWVSDCGRCYEPSLGYFSLSAAMPGFSRIEEASRRLARCENRHCLMPMAVTRCSDGSGGEGEARWHCFDCGGELSFHNFSTFCRQLWRSFGPSAHHGSLLKD